MRNFIKNLFTTILAIFISGIIIICLLFIIIIVSSSKDNKIREDSVLTLSFDTKIIESDTENTLSVFDYRKNKSPKLQDILNAIEYAKNDDKIKGISIEIDNIDAGITQINDIRNSLEDFKKSKKFIYAYGNNVSQSSYYLGSVADQYFLNPVGGIELKGLASEIVFLKDFAEKYGININVIRHGKFKAAVEPFLRKDISPENREQISNFLNDIWSEISDKIVKSRKLNQEDFNTIVDNLYATIPDFSLKHKLVDKLVQKSEYENILKSKLNIENYQNLNKVSISNYITSINNDFYSSNKIGVLYASGTIYNGNQITDIHSEKYIKYIKELADDDQIKAVVLRVNSPGGSANASDEILFELQQLQLKKPLIVSFGDYAASGGYYISMAADRIFAQNSTITGSIGVFSVIPNIKKLANNNGIYTDMVTTNSNSNMISPISGLSAGTESIMQKSIIQIYQRFIHFVAKNRKMTPEQVDTLGEGRVWSGKKAKEIGLVDEIGNLNDAIKYAGKKANLSDYQVEYYPNNIDKFQTILGSLNEEQIATNFIKKQIGNENYKLFQIFTNPKHHNTIQMLSPYLINIK